MRWVRWAVVTIIVVAVAACGEDEEVLPADEPTTPTVTVAPASPTTSTAPSTTPVAPATATEPTQGALATFRIETIPELSFQYPSSWFRTTPGSPSTLTSFDPASWTQPQVPAGGIVLQVDRISLTDPALEPRPSDATDIDVAGITGWRQIETDTFEDRAEEVQVIAIENDGYRYTFSVSFGTGADRQAISKVLQSVELH